MDYWVITQENGVCVPCVLGWMDRYDLIYISLKQPWSRSCSLLPFYYGQVPTYLHPNGHSLSCWVCMNLEGNYIPAIPLWFLEDLTSIQESPNLHKYHLETILNIIIVTAIQFSLSSLSSSSSPLSWQSGSPCIFILSSNIVLSALQPPSHSASFSQSLQIRTLGGPHLELLSGVWIMHPEIQQPCTSTLGLVSSSSLNPLLCLSLKHAHPYFSGNIIGNGIYFPKNTTVTRYKNTAPGKWITMCLYQRTVSKYLHAD